MAENSGEWLIAALSAQAVLEGRPLTTEDLSLLRLPLDSLENHHRGAALALNERVVALTRGAIAASVGAGNPTVFARPKLVVPTDWLDHYSRIYDQDLSWLLSAFLQNAMIQNTLGGELDEWELLPEELDTPQFSNNAEDVIRRVLDSALQFASIFDDIECLFQGVELASWGTIETIEVICGIKDSKNDFAGALLATIVSPESRNQESATNLLLDAFSVGIAAVYDDEWPNRISGPTRLLQTLVNFDCLGRELGITPVGVAHYAWRAADLAMTVAQTDFLVTSTVLVIEKVADFCAVILRCAEIVDSECSVSDALKQLGEINECGNTTESIRQLLAWSASRLDDLDPESWARSLQVSLDEIRAAMKPTAPDSANPTPFQQRLATLVELRKAGVISGSEYEAKRQAILDEI